MQNREASSSAYSCLRLHNRVKPEYKASLASQWNVDVEKACDLLLQYGDQAKGVLGVALQAIELDDEGSSSDSSGEEQDFEPQFYYQYLVLQFYYYDFRLETSVFLSFDLRFEISHLS